MIKPEVVDDYFTKVENDECEEKAVVCDKPPIECESEVTEKK